MVNKIGSVLIIHELIILRNYPRKLLDNYGSLTLAVDIPMDN